MPIPSPAATIAISRRVSSPRGIILRLMLRSLVERGGYDEADFCQAYAMMLPAVELAA